MFKKRYTKWTPLLVYNWAGGTGLMTFVRLNIKTGMMYFKTKRITCHRLNHHVSIEINTQQVIDNLIKQGGNHGA